MSIKKLRMEKRQAARYTPEPDDPKEALYFKNEITIKFPFDEVEREVVDLSKSGVKVFLEEEDLIKEHIGEKLKVLLMLKEEPLSVKVEIVHQSDDEYGLEYVGCHFVDIKSEQIDKIVEYLSRIDG